MAVEQIKGLYQDGSPLAPGIEANSRTALSLAKGTQLVADVLVTNPAGVPIDLSTVVPVVWSLRKNPEPLNAPALISRTCIIPAGAPRGRTQFTIVPADTVNLPAGRYVWDLRGKFPGGRWESLVGLSPFHLEPAAGFPDAPLTAPGGVTFYYAYPPLIASFSLVGGLVRELGQALSPASFAAAYNRAPSAASISDGTNTVVLASPFTSGSLAGPYNGTSIGTSQAFTLTASETGGPNLTSTLTALWQPRAFWGAAAVPGAYNEAFIEGLTNSVLLPSRAYSPGYSAGAGEKLYWCQPVAFGGAPSDFKNAATGFAIGISKVAASVSVTNAFGVTLNYEIWESDVDGLGAVTMEIT